MRHQLHQLCGHEYAAFGSVTVSCWRSALQKTLGFEDKAELRAGLLFCDLFSVAVLRCSLTLDPQQVSSIGDNR
jgi:hypothetical protein